MTIGDHQTHNYLSHIRHRAGQSRAKLPLLRFAQHKTLSVRERWLRSGTMQPFLEATHQWMSDTKSLCRDSSCSTPHHAIQLRCSSWRCSHCRGRIPAQKLDPQPLLARRASDWREVGWRPKTGRTRMTEIVRKA